MKKAYLTLILIAFCAIGFAQDECRICGHYGNIKLDPNLNKVEFVQVEMVDGVLTATYHQAKQDGTDDWKFPLEELDIRTEAGFVHFKMLAENFDGEIFLKNGKYNMILYSDRDVDRIMHLVQD